VPLTLVLPTCPVTNTATIEQHRAVYTSVCVCVCVCVVVVGGRSLIRIFTLVRKDEGRGAYYFLQCSHIGTSHGL
jgi:hypothetical protein